MARKRPKVCFTQGDGGACNWGCSGILTKDPKKITCVKCKAFIKDSQRKYHLVEVTPYQCKILSKALTLYSVAERDTKTVRDLGIMFMSLGDDT